MCNKNESCAICGKTGTLLSFGGAIHTDSLPYVLGKFISPAPGRVLVTGLICVSCYGKNDNHGICAEIIKTAKAKADEDQHDRILGEKIVDLARSVSRWYEIEKTGSASIFDEHFRLCCVCGAPYYAPHKQYCFVPFVEAVQALAGGAL